MIESIDILDNILNNNNSICVYGAGGYARAVVNYCNKRGIVSKIKNMIVTSADHNPSCCYGIDVFTVKELDIAEDIFIIVAVNECLHESVVHEIQQNLNNKYDCISSKCYDILMNYINGYDYTVGIKQNQILQAFEIADVHKRTFSEFENIHNGKEIVIVATGPSLNNYKPMEDVIHIGVNTAYKFEKIKFDYYFVQDYSGSSLKTLDDIERRSFVKFYGKFQEQAVNYGVIDEGVQIPESLIAKANAKKYFMQFPRGFGIHRDIKYYPLMDYGSVVFSAFQFALYCNPNRIYLVGCDCSKAGYFHSDQKNRLEFDFVYKGYREIKKFATYHYPDTEIISINPVGLKGMFKDIYL